MMPRFAADRMLGRLSRMLRLLGYDTAYSSSISPAEIAVLASRDNRTILTRGDFSGRFPKSVVAVSPPPGTVAAMSPSPGTAGEDTGATAALSIYVLASDDPREQLCEVVAQYSLDPRGGLFTRCTLCNGELFSVPKPEVSSVVPPKAFEAYDEFFRCTACGHIYWHGTHVDRILQNLSTILSRSLS